MRGNLLCKQEKSETQFQLCRAQPATDESQIAAVCVKIRMVDFDVHDSTALPISGFNVAMFGNDEVVRNGGAESKERRELGVVSQSSF